MKLSPGQHAYIDYAIVATFALAPAALQLSGTPAVLSYALAGVHLLLTLLSDFPGGVLKLVPFTVHGMLELVISVALVAVPWLLGFAADGRARMFFIAMGVAAFCVWLATDYKAAEGSGGRRSI